MSEAAGLRSATGPGKPYWKRPFGSTSGCLAANAGEGTPGVGAGGAVRDGAPVVVVVVVVITGGGVSFFVLYRAAVAAAPVAAPAAAMRANVTFDMVVKRMK